MWKLIRWAVYRFDRLIGATFFLVSGTWLAYSTMEHYTTKEHWNPLLGLVFSTGIAVAAISLAGLIAKK